jgi:hypothetical protein
MVKRHGILRRNTYGAALALGTILSVTPRRSARAERSHSFLDFIPRSDIRSCAISIGQGKIACGFFVNRAHHVAIVGKCADYVLGDCGTRQIARCAALEGAMFSPDAA